MARKSIYYECQRNRAQYELMLMRTLKGFGYEEKRSKQEVTMPHKI